MNECLMAFLFRMGDPAEIILSYQLKKDTTMEMESVTPAMVTLLIAIAIIAMFLAWLIVRIIYRKSRRELRNHHFDNDGI